MAGADATYAIVRKAKTMHITVTCEKSRDAEEAPPFCIELVAPGSDEPASLVYGGEGQQDQEATSRLEEAKRLILELFDGTPVMHKTAEILTHTHGRGIAKKTAETALRELVKSGHLKRCRKGCYEGTVPKQQQAA